LFGLKTTYPGIGGVVGPGHTLFWLYVAAVTVPVYDGPPHAGSVTVPAVRAAVLIAAAGPPAGVLEAADARVSVAPPISGPPAVEAVPPRASCVEPSSETFPPANATMWPPLLPAVVAFACNARPVIVRNEFFAMTVTTPPVSLLMLPFGSGALFECTAK